jgi:hypothetical protein
LRDGVSTRCSGGFCGAVAHICIASMHMSVRELHAPATGRRCRHNIHVDRVSRSRRISMCARTYLACMLKL